MPLSLLLLKRLHKRQLLPKQKPKARLQSNLKLNPFGVSIYRYIVIPKKKKPGTFVSGFFYS